MYHEAFSFWKGLLTLGIHEDGNPWDWTTLGAEARSKKGAKTKVRAKAKAKIVAKENGVWAADGLFCTIENLMNLRISPKFNDGQEFKNGQVLAELQGSVTELMAVERPLINLAAYASGIATSTRRLVKKVSEACPSRPPRVCLTRKTLPGYRDLSIHAVRVGGGFPHRVSLSGGILIKENHIAVAGGISDAVESVLAVAPHGLKIEVEVRNQQELKEAVSVGADGVLLDNFKPKEVRSTIAWLRSQKHTVFVEVSGGLTETNVQEYAIPGVDILSFGSITHSVKSIDLSFLVL